MRRGQSGGILTKRKQSSNIINLSVIWTFFLKSLFLPSDIVSINELTLIVKIIRQIDYDVAYKNNNVSFESLDKHP